MYSPRPVNSDVMPLEVMPYFSIGYPDEERLEINLVGAPSDLHSEGRDWIKGQVQINVGAFSGEIEIYLCVSDMIRFKEQLEPVYEKLEGVAEFKTIEDQLSIRIEVDNLGHVRRPVTCSMISLPETSSLSILIMTRRFSGTQFQRSMKRCVSYFHPRHNNKRWQRTRGKYALSVVE